ncbi:2-hydroxy-3-oxopropionate reductase [gamma proteobacterium IMCC1989]|nr:2-hydroxy-3-oxopropionate reductase [gamma proteobacterium IMCC1989]
MKITFLGLGVMGYPMAGHLHTAGHDVCVYNRTTAKAQKWVDEFGGNYGETPALAAKNSDLVLLCVGNDDDVREMIVGEQGVLSVLTEGAIIVDHTTTSDRLAKDMYRVVQEKGCHFIDAPVSGGQAGAENAQLAIMAGGDKTIFDKVSPILDVYAKSLLYMGAAGAGQATKMTNQLLIAGVLQGISEGFALAKSAGLDLDQVARAISAGSAGSWQLTNRAENINKDKFDYGFAVDWMRKDLGFCLQAAKAYGIELPNAQWVDNCYALLQTQGHQRSDTSVLVKQYADIKQAK